MIKTARESIHTIETGVISIGLGGTNQTYEDETSTEGILSIKKRMTTFNEKFSISQKIQLLTAFKNILYHLPNLVPPSIVP